MSAHAQNSSDTALHRRQPLWPWLLMPLATLAIFFALRNAKHSPQHTPPQMTAPDAAAEPPTPAAESN